MLRSCRKKKKKAKPLSVKVESKQIEVPEVKISEKAPEVDSKTAEKTSPQTPDDSQSDKAANGNSKKINSLDKLRELVENNISEEKVEKEEDKDGCIHNPEEIRTVWVKYLDDILMNKSKSLYNSLKNCSIEINEDGLIKLSLENDALNDQLSKEKLNIIDYFRDHHKISGLRITHNVRLLTEEERSAYLVNPREKFEFMADKNPELIKIQKNLGLQAED